LDNPRVALISHEYPPYLIGGVGSYCHDLSHFLSKREVPTTVLCGRAPRREEQRINEYLSVIRLPLPDIPLRAYWFQVRNYSVLRSAFKEFDVVHAINPQSSALATFPHVVGHALITTMHGVPRFRSKAFFNAPLGHWTLREFVSNTYEAAVDHALHKLCFKNSSKIVAVSRNSLEEARVAFHNFPIDRATLIPNGIDFERIDRIRNSIKYPPETDGESLLFCGRLVWIKGVLQLVEAVARLKRDFPNVRLRIAGIGPLSGTLHELVRRLGLTENVEFLGYLPPDNVVAEIIRSCIVVLPSTYEAGSIGMLEALACGRPLVAFDYPFAREYVTDSHNGLLARPGDANDLYGKIRLLIRDKSLRDGLARHAYEFAFEQHNWRTLTEKYIELYRQLARD